jgi:hypothetical protein
MTLTRPGRIAAGALALAVAILATLLLTLGNNAPTANAEVPDSQTLCKGHVAAGAANADDPDATEVAYEFACSNPITGYILALDHQTSAFETEIFALDATTKDVVPTDSFSCAGDVPGWSINCTGTYGGKWEVVPGTFAISEKLCDEPRVNPVLYTVRATVAAGKPVTAIAGPFDLGRPQGCKASSRNGTTHIPSDDSDATISPAVALK